MLVNLCKWASRHRKIAKSGHRVAAETIPFRRRWRGCMNSVNLEAIWGMSDPRATLPRRPRPASCRQGRNGEVQDEIPGRASYAYSKGRQKLYGCLLVQISHQEALKRSVFKSWPFYFPASSFVPNLTKDCFGTSHDVQPKIRR